MNIEEKLERMESITLALKDESTPLEEALRLFEEGVGIGREVQKSLDAAEMKVEVILNAPEDSKELTTAPYQGEEA